MSRHALVGAGDVVLARDHDRAVREIAVTTDAREVALWIPDRATLWLDIRTADRLAHLILVAANAATHEALCCPPISAQETARAASPRSLRRS